jgi:transcriptional regulator with XRE-family HTH domain
MDIANRLKTYRKTRGLSQRELAILGGVQPNAQGNYEAGTRVPRAEYFSALHGIGFDVLYILTGVPAASVELALSEDEQSVMLSYRVLPVEDQLALARVLATMALSVNGVSDEPV